jgi:hypothetical protein
MSERCYLESKGMIGNSSVQRSVPNLRCGQCSLLASTIISNVGALECYSLCSSATTLAMYCRSTGEM